MDESCNALLEALPHPALVLGPDGEIILTNSRADRLLTCGEELASRAGLLKAPERAEQGQLSRLVAEAAKGGNGCMQVRRSDRDPLLLQIRSIPAEDALNPAILVLIREPDCSAAISDESLIKVFGLTVAEARVARTLASGCSVSEAAVRLNTNISTTRTHLSAIFRKTGVTRQQDLLRVLGAWR